MVAEPQVAEEVAKIFGKRVRWYQIPADVVLRSLTFPKMNRFFIYKEYGAKYEMMIKDIASVQRAIPALDTHVKGIEILASSLGSEKKRNEDTKKRALSIGDLLVKVSTSPGLLSALLVTKTWARSLVALVVANAIRSLSRGCAGIPSYLQSF